VVLWHWQHFFFIGTRPGSFDVERQPFYSIFWVFYHRGLLAVELFFALSGFIFFWLYSERIASAAMNWWEFGVLRLSRLYPLHFATLLIVSAGQWWFLSHTGSYFVYENNDTYHFGLNLLFANSWGVENGYSFNAPSWSVSVEVMLYGVFFLILSRGVPRPATVLLIALSGLAIQEVHNGIGDGIYAFFMGGLMYMAYAWIMDHGLAPRLAIPLLAISAGLWAVSLLELVSPYLVPALIRLFPIGTSNWGGAVLIFKEAFFTGLVLPSTILSLAVVEAAHGPLGRRVAWLGDVSYASYLIHFPLQLAFAAVVISFGFDRDLFFQPFTLIAFFSLLLGLSAISHRWFELPVRELLRRRFKQHRRVRPVEAMTSTLSP
jgi:peptidoglycan/LPS O-acetylase OafA/YrhL